ncbi:MAG: hypothetical protein KBT28_04960 [Bacteroidales bacterium]|nr:hypothetical protein [Candidatus Colimorpha merdihippi]
MNQGGGCRLGKTALNNSRQPFHRVQRLASIPLCTTCLNRCARALIPTHQPVTKTIQNLKKCIYCTQ